MIIESPTQADPGSRTTDPGRIMNRLIIAIDGPSGAGKGTIARALATRLGYRHVDTGAMYRAVAWKALHDGVDLADEAAVAALAERAAFDVGDGQVGIDGHDVAARDPHARDRRGRGGGGAAAARCGACSSRVSARWAKRAAW